MKTAYAAVVVLVLVVACAGCARVTVRGIHPAGEGKSGETAALEAAAGLLQANAPVEQLKIYLSGLHVMKVDPNHQTDAHHFCHQVNEELAQCAIFDGNGRDANLVGIEYIVSERLFNTLPLEEKKYWHPHNYEILSGQLAAPWVPEAAEKELMRKKMNSYGKTWHLWNTGMHGVKGDRLPLGEPALAWSFNRDGEMLPGLWEKRDREQKIDSAEKKLHRQDLAPLAHPQEGVEAMRLFFPKAGAYPPGVAQKQGGI